MNVVYIGHKWARLPASSSLKLSLIESPLFPLFLLWPHLLSRSVHVSVLSWIICISVCLFNNPLLTLLQRPKSTRALRQRQSVLRGDSKIKLPHVLQVHIFLLSMLRLCLRLLWLLRRMLYWWSSSRLMLMLAYGCTFNTVFYLACIQLSYPCYANTLRCTLYSSHITPWCSFN